MVRLVTKIDTNLIADFVTAFFNFQKHFTHITPVNFPNIKPCIYAMWHGQQCCVYGLPNHETVSVMVSRSKDGDVIASAIENALGFKTVRGSKSRSGSIEATKQMIETLKNGEFGAITVDGPKGPAHIVKDGVIKIAKLAGVPIVPMVWYSNNFNLIKFNSWDKMQLPIFDVRLINLYGEPIYIPADSTDESDEEYRKKLEKSLLGLIEQAPKEYNKVYWHGLWKRK
ncbi:MAG: lysophospholipid acyltransferase family protein [bacterium]|nr:lysophospholipid acyltransferase family protein [bacterium]